MSCILMYKRFVQKNVVIALKDTPAIIIVGPRQCGKTTLVKQFLKENWFYVTLDDINQLQFAQDDPVGFIRNLTARHVVIDELQRVPELMLPIKQTIDENRQPGRFLLTGSANAMALPRVADSLAGRLEIINLFPLSECEIQGNQSTYLHALLKKNAPSPNKTRIREQLFEKILTGGFPEILQRDTGSRRRTWFQHYMTSIIQKDMKNLAEIEHLNVMPKLIRLLCNQVGQLMNYTEVGKQLGLSHQTVRRYLQLLEQLFIFQELPAWHNNENKRLVKTPKVHIIDSGLLCSIRQINTEKIRSDRHLFGHLLESYVLCELQRLASWFDEPLYFYHYRDKDKVEVDIVIETSDGSVIGIEVKASATLEKSDFQGLMRLKKAAGTHFHFGVLLYDGDHVNAFDQDIYSMPISAIWE